MIIMSESINEISTALIKIQMEIEPVYKSTKVQAGVKKYSYAKLEDILEMATPIANKYDVAILQLMDGRSESGDTRLVTMLTHKSGQFMQSLTEIPSYQIEKDYQSGEKKQVVTQQSVGSSITYARRYALASILGIAQEDDDANGLLGNKDKPSYSTRKKSVPTQDPKPKTYALNSRDALETLAAQEDKPIKKLFSPLDVSTFVDTTIALLDACSTVAELEEVAKGVRKEGIFASLTDEHMRKLKDKKDAMIKKNQSKVIEEIK